MDSSKYPITCLICTVFKIPKKGKKLKFFQYLDKNQNSRFPLNLIKLVTTLIKKKNFQIFFHTRVSQRIVPSPLLNGIKGANFCTKESILNVLQIEIRAFTESVMQGGEKGRVASRIIERAHQYFSTIRKYRRSHNICYVSAMQTFTINGVAVWVNFPTYSTPILRNCIHENRLHFLDV